MSLSIEVKGLIELQKANERATQEISKGNLVARAALIIERQAKMNATGRPGPKVRTGRLRASIVTEIINPNEARVGTNVFYAPFVEFGHLIGVGPGSRGGFSKGSPFSTGQRMTPSYPFLAPTIEQTKSQMGDVVVTFGREIGEEWGK